MTITLGLFDLDDTLFAHRNAVAVGVLAHLRAGGVTLSPEDEAVEVSRWNALEEHHYHRYLAGELDFHGQRRERAREFGERYDLDLGFDDAADQWFGEYFLEYQRAWSLHDDALPCLDALAGLHLGIITNGDLGFQSAKLEGVGLSSRFERVVASGSVGFAKPDARIFALACAQFGVPVGSAFYVGDRLATDAIGAAAAGLTGIWLDRDGLATDEQLADCERLGVRVIRSLAELPALVASA